MRPVLEHPPGAQQARDRRLVVAPDARAERQPVRPVDGRDRVELDGLQPPDLGGDVLVARPAEASRVALVGDDEPSKLCQRNRAHAGANASRAGPARARSRTAAGFPGGGPGSDRPAAGPCGRIGTEPLQSPPPGGVRLAVEGGGAPHPGGGERARGVSRNARRRHRRRARSLARVSQVLEQVGARDDAGRPAGARDQHRVRARRSARPTISSTEADSLDRRQRRLHRGGDVLVQRVGVLEHAVEQVAVVQRADHVGERPERAVAHDG